MVVGWTFTSFYIKHCAAGLGEMLFTVSVCYCLVDFLKLETKSSGIINMCVCVSFISRSLYRN